MIKLNIICVGKLKEKYLHEAVLEYTKRLSKFVKLNIIELPDEKVPYNPSISEINIIKQKEGFNIIKKAGNSSFVAALDPAGKMYSSEEFSDYFKYNMINSVSNFTFIIGGSQGLSNDVKKFADNIISFSKLTFTHQLIRVILLEQIYRSFKIINGEPYHH